MTRGLEALNRINGNNGNQVLDSLADVAPDLGCWIIEQAGDVYPRPELRTCAQRELVTLASLTTQGDMHDQLVVHINGALNVGCPRRSHRGIPALRALCRLSQGAQCGERAARGAGDARGRGAERVMSGSRFAGGLALLRSARRCHRPTHRHRIAVGVMFSQHDGRNPKRSCRRCAPRVLASRQQASGGPASIGPSRWASSSAPMPAPRASVHGDVLGTSSAGPGGPSRARPAACTGDEHGGAPTAQHGFGLHHGAGDENFGLGACHEAAPTMAPSGSQRADVDDTGAEGPGAQGGS